MKRARKNFIFGVVSEGLWGVGLGFFLPFTILPLALVDLGRSASAAGFLAALLSAGMSFPQAFSALALSPKFTNPKWLAWAHVPVILGPLGAGLGFLCLPAGPSTAKLIFLFGGFTLFGIGIGFMAPHFIGCIGRCIPEETRGRYFGASFAASGLAQTFSGTLGAHWAAKGGLDWGYTLCFLVSVPFMAASMVVFSFFKPLHAAPDPPPSGALKSSFRILRRRLAEPGTIRIGMLLTLLLLLVSAPGNLFTVYLREAARVDVSWFQFFTPATTLGFLAGSLLLGHLVDHRGLRTAFAVAFACGLASLAFIPFHGNSAWPSLAFASSGILSATWPVIILAMILKLSHRRESTLQAGLFNTLMSPGVFVAPLFSGWLASKAGYPWAFAAAGACGLAAFWILARDGRLDEKNERS